MTLRPVHCAVEMDAIAQRNSNFPRDFHLYRLIMHIRRAAFPAQLEGSGESPIDIDAGNLSCMETRILKCRDEIRIRRLNSARY